MKIRTMFLVCLAVATGTAWAAGGPPAATPGELVSTYETLADTILGAKKTEHNLVKAILATTYRHAESTLAQAKDPKMSSQDQSAAIERLAALVAHLGNEGDASIAGVRNRLLAGGHHHNAEGEKQGVFDEGFVIVTRAARKVFLDSAMRIGKLAASRDAKALDTEWAAVAKQYGDLMK